MRGHMIAGLYCLGFITREQMLGIREEDTPDSRNSFCGVDCGGSPCALDVGHEGNHDPSGGESDSFSSGPICGRPEGECCCGKEPCGQCTCCGRVSY